MKTEFEYKENQRTYVSQGDGKSHLNYINNKFHKFCHTNHTHNKAKQKCIRNDSGSFLVKELEL